MHSSFLKSSDFTIYKKKQKISHEDYFSHYRLEDNLAVIAPERVDGVDAALLILGYMTAFYNLKRVEGLEAGVYPQFYSIQYETPPASYGMLDIWPDRKSVSIRNDAQTTADTIIEFKITVLIVPDKFTLQNINQKSCDRLKQIVKHIYMYSEKYTQKNTDLTIECNVKEISEWILSVFDTPSLKKDIRIQESKSKWLKRTPDLTNLSQSFKIKSLDELLK